MRYFSILMIYDLAAESGSNTEVVWYGVFFVHEIRRFVDEAALNVKQNSNI
jgi:hypothetical protein